MPRLPRYVLPGQPQHVIQRGVNRCALFIVDEDYEVFKSYLKEACEKHGCHIHAYVLMTNHVHLLLTPNSENSISKTMQSTGRRYVYYFNSLYRRTGTLWEGRYKATLIDTERYLMTCHQYIELNPVRANMVQDPGEYIWSSYRSNATGKNDSLVTPHDLYTGLGDTLEQRLSVYKSLFNTQIHQLEIDLIRTSTQKGWVLGSNRFKDEIEESLNRRTRPLKRGGDRRSEAYREKIKG